jgi:hypothetical protein
VWLPALPMTVDAPSVMCVPAVAALQVSRPLRVVAARRVLRSTSGHISEPRGSLGLRVLSAAVARQCGGQTGSGSGQAGGGDDGAEAGRGLVRAAVRARNKMAAMMTNKGLLG